MKEFSNERGNPGKWNHQKKELTVEERRILSPQLSTVAIKLHGGQLFIQGNKEKTPQLDTQIIIAAATESSARNALSQKRGELSIGGKADRLIIDGRSEIDTDEREIEEDNGIGVDEESPVPTIRRKVFLTVPQDKKIAYELDTNVADTTFTDVSCRATVDTTFGNVAAVNYKGKLAVKTIGGYTTGENVTGDLIVESIDGGVIFDKFSGSANLHSTTKDVTVSDATFKGIENQLVSFSGEVAVTVKNGLLGITAEGPIGNVELPTGDFIELADSIVISEYGIKKKVWGHIGADPKPFNRITLRSEAGSVSIKKSESE
jgi:hypothetical protein